MRIILGLFLLVMIGCKTTKNNNSKTQNKQVVFQTISKGTLFGDGIEGISESNLIVLNGKAWNAIQNNMNKENSVSSSFKENSIDFSNEMVICVFDKIRSTGGFSVEIEEILIENDTTKVNYYIKKPAQGQMTSSVVTQPYHIVKMQKNDGVLVFIKK